MEVEFKDGKFFEGDESEFNKFILNHVGASVHIVKVDKDFNTIPDWMNDQFRKILGYSYTERKTMGYSNVHKIMCHPDDMVIMRQGVANIFAHPGSVQSASFRLKQKSGEWKWLMFTSRQITINGDGNYLLAVTTDINKALGHYESLFQKYSKEIRELKKQLLIKEFPKVELEIIELLCKGLTVKEIAEQRYRSPETINNHKRNIFNKAKVHKTSELVAFAIEHGLG